METHVWVRDLTTGHSGPEALSMVALDPSRYRVSRGRPVRDINGHLLPWRFAAAPKVPPVSAGGSAT